MRLIHDGGECRCDESGAVAIGESDDSHILRNTQSGTLDGVESSVGHDVVEGEDGIRPVVHLQEAQRVVACHVESYRVAHHQFALDG